MSYIVSLRKPLLIDPGVVIRLLAWIIFIHNLFRIDSYIVTYKKPIIYFHNHLTYNFNVLYYIYETKHQKKNIFSKALDNIFSCAIL